MMMVIKKTLLAIGVNLIFLLQIYAQKAAIHEHCSYDYKINNVESENNFHKDSLFLIVTEKENMLSVKIINTTNNNVFLFSSYLDSKYFSSTYLHRISKKEKLYIVSFLPLIPYLQVEFNDRIILGNRNIIEKGQVNYQFIQLPSMTYCEVNIAYEDLFLNMENKMVSNFNTKSLSKFRDIKFKMIKTKRFNNKLSLILEFAVYSEVNTLCDRKSYYLKEKEFDIQSKSFKKLSLPVSLKFYNHPLIKKKK